MAVSITANSFIAKDPTLKLLPPLLQPQKYYIPFAQSIYFTQKATRNEKTDINISLFPFQGSLKRMPTQKVTDQWTVSFFLLAGRSFWSHTYRIPNIKESAFYEEETDN